MKLPVYNLRGERAGEIEFSDSIYGVKTNLDLIHQVAVSLWGNLRDYTAHTKNKGEVRGGGKKPWKQKGTGRARAGSIRSPLWRGGGITFGPRNERNHSRKINKKVAKLGFIMGLNEKIKGEEIRIVESFSSLKPKTKELADTIDNLIKARKTTLIVSKEKNENLKRAGKNLSKVTTKIASNLNLLDLLTHKFVLIEKDGLIDLESRFLDEDKKTSGKASREG